MGTKDEPTKTAAPKEEPTKAEVKSVDTDSTYDPVAENAAIAEERDALEREQLDRIEESGRTDAATGLATDQTTPSAPKKPDHTNPTP